MSDDLHFFATKAKVTGDLGETLDARLNEVAQAATATRGVAMGLRAGSELVRALHKHVDADLEAGKIRDGLSSMEIASLVKSWITKGVNALENASESKTLESTGLHGKAEGFKAALALVQNHHTTAVTRASQIAAAATTAPPAVERKREDGERPAPSTLDERRGGEE